MSDIPKRSFLKGAVGLGALVATSTNAALRAESWPVRPIKIIVPWPAGGVADIAARLAAEAMQNDLGQPTIIENRPGASGKIGVDAAKRAAPDGYTFLFGTPSSLTLPTVVDKQLTYDALRDFKPVVQLFSSTYFLMINAALPVRTTHELIDYARSNPGKLNYGSWGPGSAPHLAGVMLASEARINIVHVPYKGEGALVQDMSAGLVQMGFVIDARPHIEAGRLRALGTTSLEPWFTLPEVPPISQSGLPGFEFLGWQGFLAPVGTPDAIILRANQAINRSFENDRMRAFMTQTGHKAVGGGPEKLTRTIDDDLRTIRKIVADAHLTFDP